MSGVIILVLQYKDINSSMFVEIFKVKTTSPPVYNEFQPQYQICANNKASPLGALFVYWYVRQLSR